MKVTLLRHTPNPDELAAKAARVCYSSSPVDKIVLNKEEQEKLLKRVIRSGHHSVLEHVSFTYALEGLSRVATHQLVRHRIASYSQRSHRYTDVGKESFVVPPSVAENPEARAIFDRVVDEATSAYRRLIDLGIKREDARFVIPQAVSSAIVVTMNARELLHFFSLRCCVRAQWEIRDVAIEMLKLARACAPLIFENAGPACVRGRCPEEKPCSNISEIRAYFKSL